MLKHNIKYLHLVDLEIKCNSVAFQSFLITCVIRDGKIVLYSDEYQFAVNETLRKKSDFLREFSASSILVSKSFL
jgi:hypothetical protein